MARKKSIIFNIWPIIICIIAYNVFFSDDNDDNEINVSDPSFIEMIEHDQIKDTAADLFIKVKAARDKVSSIVQDVKQRAEEKMDKNDVVNNDDDDEIKIPTPPPDPEEEMIADLEEEKPTEQNTTKKNEGMKKL